MWIRELATALVLLPTLFVTAYYMSDADISSLVRIGVGLVGFLLIAFVERLTPPAGPRKSAATWLLHLNITLIQIVFFVLLGPIFSVFVAQLLAQTFGFELGLFDLSLSSFSGVAGVVGATLLALIVTDFFYYWWHRAMHAVPVFWQHHKLHHMDPEFDVLTALRSNGPVEALLQGAMVALPTVIFFKLKDASYLDLGMGAAFVIFVLRLVNQLNHSNFRLGYGKLNWLVVSPQTHRIHHSLEPEHFDRNFVAFFPVWDIIFGTYYGPRKGEFPLTGVAGEKDIRSVWEAQIYTFREWWRMFRNSQAGKQTAGRSIGRE